MIRVSHLVTLMVLIVVLLGGFAVFAQGPGFGGPRGRGPVAGPGGPGAAGLPIRELGLTDAQQQQVRQLTEQFREQGRLLIEQVRKAEEARRDAIEAVPVDEGRIRAAMHQLGEAQTEWAIHQARLRSEIYELLTPEQQQVAQKLRADREARLKQRQDRLEQRLQQRGQRNRA